MYFIDNSRENFVNTIALLLINQVKIVFLAINSNEKYLLWGKVNLSHKYKFEGRRKVLNIQDAKRDQ